MNTEIFYQQIEQAKTNMNRPVSSLKVGDFVLLDTCELKNERFAEILHNMYKWYIYHNRLSMIESITYCTDSELFENKFKFAKGGCRSDVFENDEDYKNCPDNEQYKYYYTLVTLVITDTGKYAFCDAEGYNYPRYLLFWPDWKVVFEKELNEEIARCEEFRQKKLEEEESHREQLKQEQEKEISEKWNFLDPKKSVKANWITACKVLFDFPVKVSKHTDYYNKECIVLTCGNEEERLKVRETIREIQNHFLYCTGKHDIGYDGYRYMVYRNRIEDHVPNFFYNVSTK